MKLFLIALIAIVATAGDCCNSKTKVSEDCKGEAKKDCVCTMQYDPVCGCDGKTYGNACSAQCEGVKSWTKGECR